MELKGNISSEQKLKGKITAIPQLDETLTKHGYSADAKATGEAIAKAKNEALAGSRPNTWMPSATDVGAHPNTWMPTPEQIGALPISGGTMSGNISFGWANGLQQLQHVNNIGIRELEWRDPPEGINIPTPQRFTALVSVSFNGGGYALYQVTSNSGRYIDNVTKLNGNVDHVSFTINTDYILTITSNQNWSHGFVIWSF